MDSHELDNATSNTNSTIGKYLVNTEGNLGYVITTDRITKYNEGLLGKTNEKHDTRQIYFDCISSLCCVTCTTSIDNRLMYSGSCSDFWKTKYCNHAAVFQYKTELQTNGIRIASNNAERKPNRNHSKNVVTELKKKVQYNSYLCWCYTNPIVLINCE